MNINQLIQEIYTIAHSKHSDITLQIQKEDAIKLSYYIDSLEDKERILYMILGGIKNEKEII